MTEENAASGTENNLHCGYVALIGRPNVGKSTLLNALVGQKISIVTRKPQTTRQRIAGIVTRDDGQVVLLDTPGIHTDEHKAINRYMNRTSKAIVHDADVVLWILEAGRFTKDDEHIEALLAKVSKPVVVALNKVDALDDQAELLPFIDQLRQRLPDVQPFPISALKGDGVQQLIDHVAPQLPMSRPFYGEDEVTDRSMRFIAAELIREQLFLRLHQEVPYASTVGIEAYEIEGRLARIHAVIWVERPSQKSIVIGKGGQTLKWIGQRARTELEAMTGMKVMLKTWVKVADNWSDNDQQLGRLGYQD